MAWGRVLSVIAIVATELADGPWCLPNWQVCVSPLKGSRMVVTAGRLSVR